ncbi:hypothetical protein PENTCL1PPCAC_8828, partial [Pristionchus entomophagus]
DQSLDSKLTTIIMMIGDADNDAVRSYSSESDHSGNTIDEKVKRKRRRQTDKRDALKLENLNNDREIRRIIKEKYDKQKSVDALEAELRKTYVKYSSRFNDEYKFIRILGYGCSGFVFEVKSRLDKKRYAVKRIAFEPRDYEKVLKETKALAKLDDDTNHVIRYYDPWIEKPPKRWKDYADSMIIKKLESREKRSMEKKTEPSKVKRC